MSLPGSSRSSPFLKNYNEDIQSPKKDDNPVNIVEVPEEGMEFQRQKDVVEKGEQQKLHGKIGKEKKRKEEEFPELPNFSLELRQEEISEDIYGMTGNTPSRTLRKREKNVQKQIEMNRLQKRGKGRILAEQSPPQRTFSAPQRETDFFPAKPLRPGGEKARPSGPCLTFTPKVARPSGKIVRPSESDDAAKDFYSKLGARAVELDRPSEFNLWKYNVGDFFPLFGGGNLFSTLGYTKISHSNNYSSAFFILEARERRKKRRSSTEDSTPKRFSFSFLFLF